MTRYKRTIFGGKKKKRSKYGLSKPKKNKQRRKKQTKKRRLVEPTITMTGSGGTNNTGFVYNNLSGDPILTAVGKYTINVHKSVSSAGRSYIYLTGTGELTMDAEL